MVYDWASTDRLGLLIFFGIGYAYSGLSRCVCLAFSLVVSFFFFGDTGGCVFYVLFFPCLFVFTHAPQPFLAVTLGCIFSSFFFYSDEMCDLDTRNSIVYSSLLYIDYHPLRIVCYTSPISQHVFLKVMTCGLLDRV